MKHTANLRRHKVSDAELESLIELNQDLNRIYPQQRTAPAIRSRAITAALRTIQNPYRLVHAAHRVFLSVHDGRTNTFSHDINQALAIIAARKPVPDYAPIARPQPQPVISGWYAHISQEAAA